MVIRNKILIGLCALLFMAPCSSLLADPKVDALVKQMGDMAKQMNEMRETTTAIAINEAAKATTKVADSFSKGTTVKHSLSFSPSIFFGFGACIGLYSVYRGITNYLFAHQRTDKERAKEHEEKNKSAAETQIKVGVLGLLASALGFYWTSK